MSNLKVRSGNGVHSVGRDCDLQEQFLGCYDSLQSLIRGPEAQEPSACYFGGSLE